MRTKGFEYAIFNAHHMVIHISFFLKLFVVLGHQLYIFKVTQSLLNQRHFS